MVVCHGFLVQASEMKVHRSSFGMSGKGVGFRIYGSRFTGQGLRVKLQGSQQGFGVFLSKV
jgi:hypothetical protein